MVGRTAVFSHKPSGRGIAHVDRAQHRPPGARASGDFQINAWVAKPPLRGPGPVARQLRTPWAGITATREILNPILVVNRTGCHGTALPHDFPNWKTVSTVFCVGEGRACGKRSTIGSHCRVEVLDGGRVCIAGRGQGEGEKSVPSFSDGLVALLFSREGRSTAARADG